MKCFLLTLFILLSSHHLYCDDDVVTMQVQMTMSVDGQLVDGDDKTLDVSLAYPNAESTTVIWEKTYHNIAIYNGQLIMTLAGEDNHGQALLAEMFDHDGVQLMVRLSGTIVDLDVVSQPYAIKSRISNQSHSVSGIQGFPIKKSDEVNDGDVLIFNDGQWVISRPEDGGIHLSSDDTISELNGLDDVILDAATNGEVLGYNGNDWVNVSDQKLTESDVDRIVSEAGYIKSIGENVLSVGEYDQIRGIGGKIKVDPMIQLKDNVEIEGNAFTGGTLGQSMFPISQAVIEELKIKGHDDDIQLTKEGDDLIVNQSVMVEDKVGVLISGEGSTGKIAVYNGVDEIGFDDHLMWDNSKKQLGVGGDTSQEGIELNIDGGIRVAEDFVVGTEVVNVNNYVKPDAVAQVAISGAYSDVVGAPDLNQYVKTNEFNNKLANEFYNKQEVGIQIDQRIESFNGDALLTAFQRALESYDTRVERDEALHQSLTNHHTIADASDTYVDHEELGDELASYSTTTKIKDEILQDYIKTEDVSAVGKSGSYEDIIDWPLVILKDDYLADKITFDDTYATKVEMIERVETHGESIRSQVLASVATNMVSKQQLIDEQFATQASVDALSRIARSGAYQDLLGIPDLSVYMEKNRVSAEYMDTGEVGTALREYMKQNEVSEVGKTGRFEDLIGAPAMTEYQRVDEMNQYVKASDFDNEMLTVLKADTFGGADVADLENISDFDNKLLAYPKRVSYQRWRLVANTKMYWEQVILSTDLHWIHACYLMCQRLN